MISGLVSSPKRIYLIALISGAVMPLAFAPFGWSPLLFMALGALFGIWTFTTPLHAFRSGYAFGLGSFGVGVSWVYVSMHDFGGVAVPVATLLTAMFVAVLAIYPALAGWLYARWLRSDQTVVALLLGLPAAWCLTEWCRGWLFSGFPWLEVGYSQVDTPLSGYATLMGSYGVSSVAALLTAFGVAMLLRRIDWKLGGLFIAVIVAGGVFLKSTEWTAAAGAPVRVALLQGNVSQDVKWKPEQRQPTIDLYVDMTRENWDTDLIVWPETALPAFQHQAKTLLDELGAEARTTKTDVLVGVPIMNLQTRQYYNSMVSLGSSEQSYTKQHLVPFGEFIPWAAVLGRLMEIMQVPLPDFSVIHSSPVLTLAGQPMGISICYEDAFGSEVIRALPQATVLINASNDAWFGDSLAPHQHLQMARMRAIETQRPMMRVTNTGVTAVIDHRGVLTSVAPQFSVAALRATLQPMQGVTPYVRGGNFPILIMLLLFIGITLWRRRV